MIIYPAIDIYGGRVVRMTRGDFSTVEEVAPSPLEAANRLVKEGAEWLHIVDIDGARTGEPANLDAIRQIANRFTVKIQAGGGIRDFDTAEAFAERARRASSWHSRDRGSRAHRASGDRQRRRNGGVASTRERDGHDRRVDREQRGARRRPHADTRRDRRAVGHLHQRVGRRTRRAGLAGLEAVARAFAGKSLLGRGRLTGRHPRLARLRHRGLRGVIVGRALYWGRFSLPMRSPPRRPLPGR